MRISISLVFALTYLLIASRRLNLLPIGRPGGALLGAVLMVAIGALSPEESYAAIDHDTIVLLFSMMLLSVYLDEAGIFVRAASWLVSRAKTPWRLLVGVSLLAGCSSAFLLNDTVCVFLTPLIVTICARARLPLGPYLIGLATSANIGSAATLVGNPQNMIIGSLSKLRFIEFSKYAALPAAVGLVINIVLLGVYYRRSLPTALEWKPELNEQHRVPTAFIHVLEGARNAHVILILASIVLGFLLGLHLAYTALAGVLALILVERRDPRAEFSKIDWPLLVFFASLFIVIAGFAKTGIVEDLWRRHASSMALTEPDGLARFTVFVTVASNIVSNVPLVLLTGPHLSASGGAFSWVILAFVSTVAGNLTLVGSVANIIVAEAARDRYFLGFREYLRFGVVSTTLVLAAGVPIAVLVFRWLP